MYIIRTDSMKIRDDFQASLEFVDDNTGEYVYLGNRIDTAGYRYRSFWQANTSCDDCGQPIYRRYYPSDTTYKWWDGQTANCLTTFLRDSLSVVGGSLSVDCNGALSPLQDIDNCFLVNTDTTINDTARATKLILVDQDPSNNEFSDSLELDIMRAIAWNEYAGSEDERHCSEPYNPQWNNYWDHVITGQDTCFETLYPCENIRSSATGTMQMLRSVWARVFDGSSEGLEPDGYFISTWDSLAWNWKINVFNGKYIHQVSLFSHFRPEQAEWDSLYFPSNDYTPNTPNQEDLATYGYKEGATKMRYVKNEEIWKDSVMTFPYIVGVRRWKDTRPWED